MRRTQRGVAVGMGIKRIRWDLKNENDLVSQMDTDAKGNWEFKISFLRMKKNRLEGKVS